MPDPLKITNEIWQKWDEQKIKPPLSWIELRKFVEESIRLGTDPYVLLPWSEEKRAIIFRTFKKEIPAVEIQEARIKEERVFPWPNLEAQATVEQEEIPTFNPAMLDLVKKAWKTKQPQRFWEWIIEPSHYGVLVGLRGASRPHEFFPETIIESTEFLFPTPPKAKGTTFYFETHEDRKKARELLSHHNFYFPDGPDFSLTDIDDPDYMLELLDSEGFNTSKIMVEKHE